MSNAPLLREPVTPADEDGANEPGEAARAFGVTGFEFPVQSLRLAVSAMDDPVPGSSAEGWPRLPGRRGALPVFGKSQADVARK